MLWDEAQAAALGTAPLAKFWVALEQNGPWGVRAATQSHLDPELGGALDRMCQKGSGRLILIRRPGRHPDLHDDDLHHVNPQRVYIAGGLTDSPWLLEADLDDPGRLARLERLPTLAPLGRRGSEGAVGRDALRNVLPELQPSPGPVLMICTNSRRDVCCSLRGRPVAAESAALRPGQIWECSHTGGHRFAPTGVLLPYGQTFGRLSGSSAVAALDAGMHAEIADQLLGARYDRGRSHLIAAGQVAESQVREHLREHRLLALSTTVTPRSNVENCSPQNSGAQNSGAQNSGEENSEEDNTWSCRVSHTDGRHWDVLVVRRPSGAPLPESCGKEPVPMWQWSVLDDAGRPILEA